MKLDRFSDKQYCWPAETAKWRTQHGAEFYEGSLFKAIGICFIKFFLEHFRRQ